MIRNVLLLLAAFLSVTLPTPAQLTLDRRAEFCASDVGVEVAGVLEDVVAKKSEKRVKKSPDKSSDGPGETQLLISSALRRAALRVSHWPLASVAEPAPIARAPIRLSHDARRAVRRHRSSIHVPRMADDDPPAA